LRISALLASWHLGSSFLSADSQRSRDSRQYILAIVSIRSGPNDTRTIFRRGEPGRTGANRALLALGCRSLTLFRDSRETGCSCPRARSAEPKSVRRSELKLRFHSHSLERSSGATIGIIGLSDYRIIRSLVLFALKVAIRDAKPNENRIEPRSMETRSKIISSRRSYDRSKGRINADNE